jgi:putative endopeptidase
MKLTYKVIYGALITVLLVSCSQKEENFQDPLITNRDTTVSPSVDFFHYANGGWFKKHPIPNLSLIRI